MFGRFLANLVHGAVDVGVEMLAVRNDTGAVLAGTDGDYIPLTTDANGNQYETLGTKIAGEDLTNDVMKVEDQCTYTNISASALIKTGAGRLTGFVVNSAAAGATLKLWDNTSAATTILLNTMTFTLASAQGPFTVLLPSIKFSTGLYATIAVAAMDVTLLWA